MSTATDTAADAHGHDEHESHGLSDVGYIGIAIILAILTAVEVATYFVDFGAVERLRVRCGNFPEGGLLTDHIEARLLDWSGREAPEAVTP